MAALRSRDLHTRADWVERELPELIDPATNAALLRTLDINLDALAPDAWTTADGPDAGSGEHSA